MVRIVEAVVGNFHMKDTANGWQPPLRLFSSIHTTSTTSTLVGLPFSQSQNPTARFLHE